VAPKHGRRHVTKRVVLTGSECTGKTTLAQSLASAFGAPVSEEFSRRYADRHRGGLGPVDVEPIARGQIEAEDGARTPGAILVVHDTDLVSTVVYARHYYGECPAWIVAAARRRRADLYLLCHPDVLWTGDGIRDQPEHREHIHRAFADTLAEIGARVVDVRGLGPGRDGAARRAVAALISDGSTASGTTAPGEPPNRSRR
jgi:NadR type nicotinamide-nucleotide adenylyltransferase